VGGEGDSGVKKQRQLLNHIYSANNTTRYNSKLPMQQYQQPILGVNSLMWFTHATLINYLDIQAG
jgi:serine protease inhibitor ecotin